MNLFNLNQSFFLHKIYDENTGQYEVQCNTKRLQTKLHVKKDLDISTLYSLKCKCYHSSRGRHGHDRMAVGFTTTYEINAYHH